MEGYSGLPFLLGCGSDLGKGQTPEAFLLIELGKASLITCDICVSVWSLLHIQRLACLEGNYSFWGLPNLRRRERGELGYGVTILNKCL